MVWVFVSPQYSFVEILTPKVIVLEGGAFVGGVAIRSWDQSPQEWDFVFL